jgi:hypothetical protein
MVSVRVFRGSWCPSSPVGVSLIFVRMYSDLFGAPRSWSIFPAGSQIVPCYVVVSLGQPVILVATPHCGMMQELPDADSLPLLCLYQDQCSVGWSACHFLCEVMSLLIVFFCDLFHRDWNSVKLACQATDEYLWGTVVQLTVVFNLSRAPWSSSAFWRVKEESLQHMIKFGQDHPVVHQYLPRVAAELGKPMPRTAEDIQALRFHTCVAQRFVGTILMASFVVLSLGWGLKLFPGETIPCKIPLVRHRHDTLGSSRRSQ